MDKKIIEKIAWWIPNKNIRELFRESINNLLSINNNISIVNNNLIDINDNISIINNNISYNDKIKFIESKKNILTQEMIDILFENNTNIFILKLIYLWHRKNITNNFLELLYFISNKEKSWEYMPNRFWLIYISSLYQTNNNLELAEYLLDRYIKKYDLTEIHNFLHVAKFAKELGIITKNIEKAIFILNTLNSNIENKILENKLKNKRVAIIGNGPQENGKYMGKYIDSYDVVIRLNNFPKEEFEKDYGSKTDIWITNLSRGFEYQYYYSDAFTCLAIDINRFFIPEYQFYKLYDELYNDNKKVTYIDSDTRDLLIKNIGEIHPTTGLISIFKVFEEKRKNNEILSYKDIYGFSFLDTSFSYKDIQDMKHYDNTSIDFITYHNMYKEILFLRKLFNLN